MTELKKPSNPVLKKLEDTVLPMFCVYCKKSSCEMGGIEGFHNMLLSEYTRDGMNYDIPIVVCGKCRFSRKFGCLCGINTIHEGICP